MQHNRNAVEPLGRVCIGVLWFLLYWGIDSRRVCIEF